MANDGTILLVHCCFEGTGYGEVLLACWSVKVFFDKVDGSYGAGNVGGSVSKVRCDNGSC